jgi:hypothetical protein
MPKIDRVQLKRDIYQKFGSLTSFSKVANINYNRLLRIINTQNFTGDEILEIQRLYMENDLSNGVDGYISDSERKAIRLSIVTHFNSYTDFCREHPYFDTVYITNIIKGNLKMSTKKYEKLINILKKDYNYDEFTEKV